MNAVFILDLNEKAVSAITLIGEGPIAVTLIEEIHNLTKYKVCYMNFEYYVIKEDSASGTTFNYDAQEIEGIPKQIIDCVEDWLSDNKFLK